MIKEDLVRQCSIETGITKRNIQLTIDSLLNIIKSEVANNNTVVLRGFGSFSCVEHSPKKFYNPKTNTTTTLPSRKRPKFNASKSFQAMLEIC